MTADSIDFGTDDIGVGTIKATINDKGGSERFGEIAWSSETEANA